jgi:hypothetical protein
MWNLGQIETIPPTSSDIIDVVERSAGEESD